MRVERIGRTRFAIAVGAALVATVAGVLPAPASASVGRPTHAFKVVISPAYATAGLPTTFQVTISNTSSQPTPLDSVKLTPPSGFKLAHAPAPLILRRKELVRPHLFLLHQISVKPGGHKLVAIIATPPANKCGKSPVRWSSHAFEGGSATGPQLALQSALSSQGVLVVCPMVAPCGDGGPACSTVVTTSGSSYMATSDSNSGNLLGTLDVGTRLTCAGYHNQDPNWYESVVNQTNFATTFKIQYTLKGGSPSRVRACVGLAYRFTTAAGTKARPGKLPNGKPGFIGLLPACGPNTIGPCVVSITTTPDPNTKTGVDTNITARIPPNAPGDPWLGP